MKVVIDRFDDLGRGIAYVGDKVTFVPNTIPGDRVAITITKESKKYNIAKVDKYLKLSSMRVKPKCPYFDICGGCTLQNISYEDTINYKYNKVKNLFKKNKIDINPTIIKNPSPFNYRNKISLKVIDKKIGFYEESTHNIVEINECIIASDAINKTIPLIKEFNIINGSITIRCNKNNEILIILESNDKLNIDINYLKSKIKLVGIVINNEIYYGDNFLIENINDYFYKISYDSFFQVNPYVASILFNEVSKRINEEDTVLDLYCGVGTLSLNATRAKEVIGVEIVENAILNAIFNARINKIDNVKFILNDSTKAIVKINKKFSKVIVDPPRGGLTKTIIENILKVNPEEVIYVSCDPATLVRDILLFFDKYRISEAIIFDMFSYTYHVETMIVLKRKF